MALAITALLAAVSLLFARALTAAAVLGIASAGDLALLVLLPRLALSFGPIAPAWSLFAAGRAAAGALAALAALLLGAAGSLLVLGVLQLALTGAALWGALVEPFRLEETRLSLRLRGLGGPLRLLLFTDLHLERLTRRESAVLRAVQRGRPDLILIGGDLLNLSFVDDERAADDARRFVSELSAPAGVLFVRGTPEVDTPQAVSRVLGGLSVVRLEGELLEVRHGAAALQVLGLPADATHEEQERRLAALAGGAGPGPKLCLHHTPDLVPAAARLGIDLCHTHGGQISLPWIGPLATASRYGRRYHRGYHRLGSTQAYVSRGLGMEGLGAPRLRFGASPELVWIELVPE